MDDNNQLNIAGRTAAYFIDSKLTVLIMLFAFLVGLFAYLQTPREENPTIVVPAANVIIQKPGATAVEVEQLIVKPLEAIVQGLDGVEHTYGVAMDSLGVVSVQFFVGEDKEDAMVRLYDRIMSNIDRIPPGTQQPLVKPVDVDDVPILTISLACDSGDCELRRTANEMLEHLRRVAGTSLSWVHGGYPRAINVNLDLDRMRRYNVTLADIKRVVEATNLDMPSGTFVDGDNVARVQAGGALKTAEDVGNLVVSLWEHKPVYLKQIADVVDGPEDIDRETRIGFGPAFAGEQPATGEVDAVTIAIAKRTGTNAVSVADDVLAKLDLVRSLVIPENVSVHVTRNDGDKANDAVNLLMEHLAIAIVTVVILLVMFLGWRAASIVTVTIPLILFVTLAVGYVAGQSINRITLFALILSLGLLVDDSIVVIENIFRHYSKKGVDRMKGAIAAINEIGKPTNLATFTVILAFLPMFWVTGMMGPYMAPIPFNVPVAMLVSLGIAYTVAPWLAYRFLKVKGHEHEGITHEGHNGLLERGYSALMSKLIQSRPVRWLFYLLLLLLFVAVMAMPALDMVLFKMLPKNNTNTFVVSVEMPEGTSIERTDQVAREVGEVVRGFEHVETWETTVGESGVVDFNGLLRGSSLKQGTHIAEVRVNLSDRQDRDESSIDIALAIRQPLAEVAERSGANIKVVEDPPGPPVRATILAELYGPDYNKLREIAKELREQVFRTTDDVVDIDDTVTADVVEYDIVVDNEKAMLTGIAPATIAETLRAFVAGLDIGTVHYEHEKEPVPIRVRIPAADRSGPEDLSKVFFTTPQGRQVQLTDIASIKQVVEPKPIYHKDQYPVVYVSGELASSSQVYAVYRMWDYLNQNELPSGVKLEQYFMADPDTTGYSVRWDGEMRLTLDVFRDLGSAFAVAIILIYLVLVAYYRSFSTPIIVMGAIPLTIIGVLPGHAIMDQYFTATSMIGVIALAGIVVRNSLLLIDFILEYRRDGNSLEKAVLEAGKTRLRPIMLTAFAIILGTFIIVFDPVFGGLAVSLIFGTFASTVLTLLVIPLVYLGYERRLANR